MTADALEKALRFNGVAAQMPKSEALIEQERAERNAASAEKRRQEIIKAISAFCPSTDGRSYTHYNEYGTASFYPISDLLTMSLEQLLSIHEPIVERQRQRNKSAEEIRQEIKAASLEAKQQQHQETQSPVEGYKLIKPDSYPEREYTKRELIRHIDGEDEMRKLLTYPSGKSRPGAKEAIERILRGKN